MLHPVVPYLLIPLYIACAWAWWLRVGEFAHPNWNSSFNMAHHRMRHCGTVDGIELGLITQFVLPI